MMVMFYTIFWVRIHANVAFTQATLPFVKLTTLLITMEKAVLRGYLVTMKKLVSDRKHGTIGAFNRSIELALVAKANDKR